MKKLLSILFVTIIIITMFSEPVQAIPAFARKYNMSCQTCHNPFPKLKDYGDEFAGNGFALSDKEATRYFVKTGDDDLDLIRDFPLAVRLEAFVTYNNKKSELTDFGTPYNLKLLSGGALTKDVAYYFYFFFSERGEVAGVEDAFFMFNNLFNQDLDLYVGQFQVSDPLFKRELRLTFEDYQAYKSSPGRTLANLTYDRGIMLTYGLETGTDIIFEVLNGNGISSANEKRVFDNDKYKNFFGRISQDVIEGFRIGAFGYLGKEKLEDNLNNSFINTFNMWGPDITLSLYDKIEMNLQYLQRKDKKADFLLPEVTTKGMLGELIYTPEGDESKWYGVLLYNWVESNIAALDYKAGTAGMGYMLKRNIRLIGEYTYDFEYKYGQGLIGVISAF